MTDEDRYQEFYRLGREVMDLLPARRVCSIYIEEHVDFLEYAVDTYGWDVRVTLRDRETGKGSEVRGGGGTREGAIRSLIWNVRKEDEFLSFSEMIQDIVHGEGSWKHRYDTVFTDKNMATLKRLRPRFNYYDPDTTYQDDVSALAEALEEEAARVRKSK